MTVTKITVSTAMRARDVSRPGAEHLEAAGREETATRGPEVPVAAPVPVPVPVPAPAPAPVAAAPAAPAAPRAARQPGLAEPAQAPSRRRRRRGR